MNMELAKMVRENGLKAVLLELLRVVDADGLKLREGPI